MQSYTKFLIIVIVACLASAGFAQEAATTSAPDEAGDMAFPYFAEITGDNLYVRSGPGTNFYQCGRLSKGDQVKVIGRQFSWARIVPPPGSFSWISMQYVTIDPKNPKIGNVTGDRVRVYAGSDYVKPLYSTTLQGKLDKGDKVTLLGEQMDDYYKITPPPFAYLWVSTNFTKPIKPVEKVPPLPVIEKTMVKPPTETKETTEEVVTEPLSPEEMLEKYQALQKQVEAERAKPMGQQDYTNIKEGVAKIANTKEAGKAARYAEFLVKQIEGFELALVVAREVRLQDEQLASIKGRIKKAQATRLAEFEDLGRFTVVGKFQTFATYGPGHYRIIGESDKTVCYALPSGRAEQMDLSKLIGRKVGLVGSIEPRPQAPPRALVRFSEIVELR